MKKTVCVDLDGVLADYRGWKGVEHIGEPRPGASEFMARLYAVAKVVVFTTRCKADDAELGRDGETPERLAAVVSAWLDRNDIPYHSVYVGQGKPIAAAYVDDRAVAVPTNPEAGDFGPAFDRVSELLTH